MALRPQQQQYEMPASQVLAQESASAFMAKVYRWMVAGLALSAGTAWVVASSNELFSIVRGLYLPLVIGQLVVVFAFSMLARRLNAVLAGAMFLGYSFLSGLTFSAIFFVYNLPSITTAFLVTAGMFGALSLYGTVTKKDLSSWGTFLFMGLIGIIIASVVVFAGLTAYDTQKLREMHASSGYASEGSLAINGALVLYLDFINLFLALLRLLGSRR